ncbi:hypothetical protein JW868_00585 [Candidatus Woesearchaeota archaeon]|nr:hypothetical protein [Candidatus Woesearchaeota archaeon]
MKKSLITVLTLFVLVMFLSACESTETPTGEVVDDSMDDSTGDTMDDIGPIMEEDLVVPEDTMDDTMTVEEIQVPEEFKDIAVRIEATEGDLIDLNPLAIDPDGDRVTYSFSQPLDEKGVWQTKDGDEGHYVITVGATDGKAKTTEEVLLIIKPSNKAPQLVCPEQVTANEGESFELDCEVYDKEGDEVVVMYSGWMGSDEKDIGYDEAGVHKVFVRANDGNRESTATIEVTVKEVNRVPELSDLPDLEAIEDDIITLKPTATDPDGDAVTIAFSAPFDNNGVFATIDGDDGEYDVTVSATDSRGGKSTTSFSLLVLNKNNAPIVKKLNSISVYEGERIVIDVEAEDPDGDELIVKFTGFMTTNEYLTTYEDAGQYTVTISVGDGDLETVQRVPITVIDKNRAPIFRVPA